MPDYAVSTTFKGKDNVSHLFSQMERAAGRYSNTARDAFRGVGREADHASTALRNATKHGYSFGSIVKGILAANAIRGGIGYITGGFAKIGTDFLQFGDNMTGAVARFDEVDTRSSAFGAAIESMGKQVRNSMLGTRHSANDGAMALNELAKAGYNSQAALKILPNLTDFATAAQENLAEATTMSSDILGAFGLRNDNVAVQLKNHVKLNDELTKSALISTGGLRDMYETLQVVAPLSNEMKTSQEQVMALVVALSNAGIKGSEAGTAIKRGMLQLYASTRKAELEINGVFPFDKKTGQARVFTAVLGDLSNALGKLTPEQRIPVIRDIFGVYGLAGQIKMMRELKKIAEYEKQIGNADGISHEKAAAANTSPLAKLMILGNTAIEKGFQVLEQYTGKGKEGLDALTARINRFDVRPLVDALSLTGRTMWGLYQIIRPFMPALPYLVGGFLAWKTVLAGFAALKFAAAFTELAWGVALMEGVLAGGGLAAGLWAIAAPLAVIGANLVIWREVAKSLQGQDNFISRGAQALGLVPKLAHDAEGNVIGRSNDQYGWTPWDNGNAVDAPNAKEAKARTKRDEWKGILQFGNLPEGSTFNGQPLPNPWVTLNGLGANP